MVGVANFLTHLVAESARVGVRVGGKLEWRKVWTPAALNEEHK